jgi:hypothetical protein
MNQSVSILFRRLTAARSAGARAGTRGTAALALRLGGTALLAWAGYLHLHLWLEGYRHIPVNGPLFLLDAIAAFGLAALLIGWPRPLAGLLAAGFLGSTLGALIISLSVGLFGFRESIHASFVVQSLVTEAVAALALLAWAVMTAVRPLAAGATGRSVPRSAGPEPAAATRPGPAARTAAALTGIPGGMESDDRAAR